jgi:hypothetical protein
MEHREQVRRAETRIVDDLTRCEDSIAELYKTYGQMMPHMNDFWVRLSRGEEARARLLTAVRRLLDKGHLFYNIGKFDSAGIQTLYAYVNHVLAAAKKATPSDANAVCAALSIQVALAEVHFSNVFHSDVPPLNYIAGALSKNIQSQKGAIESRMEAIHSSQASSFSFS